MESPATCTPDSSRPSELEDPPGGPAVTPPPPPSAPPDRTRALYFGGFIAVLAAEVTLLLLIGGSFTPTGQRVAARQPEPAPGLLGFTPGQPLPERFLIRSNADSSLSAVIDMPLADLPPQPLSLRLTSDRRVWTALGTFSTEDRRVLAVLRDSLARNFGVLSETQAGALRVAIYGAGKRRVVLTQSNTLCSIRFEDTALAPSALAGSAPPARRSGGK